MLLRECVDCRRTWGTRSWMVSRLGPGTSGLCESCAARRRAETRLWLTLPNRAC